MQYKLHTVKAKRTDCLLFPPKIRICWQVWTHKLRMENYVTGNLIFWDFKIKKGIYFKAKLTLWYQKRNQVSQTSANYEEIVNSSVGVVCKSPVFLIDLLFQSAVLIAAKISLKHCLFYCKYEREVLTAIRWRPDLSHWTLSCCIQFGSIHSLSNLT